MRKKPQPRTYSKDSLVFIAIGVLLMLAIHFLFLGTFNESEEPLESAETSVAITGQAFTPVMTFAQKDEAETVAEPSEGYIYPLFAEYHPGEAQASVDDAVQEALQPNYRYELKNPRSEKARIAIIIDDVGMNRLQSRVVSEMEGAPLTLALLPYATNLEAFVEPAKKAGHELIIHMPMEPMNSEIDTGPIALKSEMNANAVREMMEKAFNSFDGYVGLNNHMGSRLTQDQAAMDLVMDILDERGLFYVDSKTISTSVAAKAAREQGISYAVRDVFLDHEDSPEFVRKALQRVEKVALENGSAIAIGHPHKNTVNALKEWLPTLEGRGFEVVPVSSLLLQPASFGPVLMAEAEVPETFEVAKKELGTPMFVLEGAAKKDVAAEDVARIEPAAGDASEKHDSSLAEEDVNVVESLPEAPTSKLNETSDVDAEDLLSAPIGVSEEAAKGFTGGIYSLSE
jgi:hypothetical protein